MLKETRNCFQDSVHLGQVFVLSNLSESQSSFDLVIVWRIVALNDTKKFANIFLHVGIILRDNDGSNLGRWSLCERNLIDQVIDFFLADDLLSLSLNKEILELNHNWLSVNLRRSSELDCLHENLRVLSSLWVQLNKALCGLNRKRGSQDVLLWYELGHFTLQFRSLIFELRWVSLKNGQNSL